MKEEIIRRITTAVAGALGALDKACCSGDPSSGGQNAREGECCQGAGQAGEETECRGSRPLCICVTIRSGI